MAGLNRSIKISHGLPTNLLSAPRSWLTAETRLG